MGFATNIVLGCSSFLLGMVFVSQVVDIPLLYMPLTEEAIENGYAFYRMWYEAPGAVKALFHAAMGAPLIVLLFKLHKWNESAKFFDGSSIALHLGAIVLYLTVHINALRTFLPDAKSTWTLIPAAPPFEKPPTADEKMESVRVLAAGNTLCGLLLLGVIGMQIGQEYAGKMEAAEQKAIDEAASKAVDDKPKKE